MSGILPDSLPAGDPTALERLRGWGGEELVRKILAVFREQVPRRLQMAREGVRTGSAEPARSVAHALKSSSGQLGAMRMQALCQHIEEVAGTGLVEPIPPLLDTLDDEFTRYLGWLTEVHPGSAE